MTPETMIHVQCGERTAMRKWSHLYWELGREIGSVVAQTMTSKGHAEWGGAVLTWPEWSAK